MASLSAATSRNLSLDYRSRGRENERFSATLVSALLDVCTVRVGVDDDGMRTWLVINVLRISVPVPRIKKGFRLLHANARQPNVHKMSLPAESRRDHHIGSPPTHFRNPWPSFSQSSLLTLLNTRFSSKRNFVPVPENREGLVEMVKPTFGHEAAASSSKLKATWIGHASWFIEFACQTSDTASTPSRGVTALLDPVFAERTSPAKWIGPKRYTPVPCTIAELPEVDLVVISHNHYDHLDYDAITEIHKRSPRTHFICPLNNKTWFVGAGIPAEVVHELDWWSAVTVQVTGVGSVTIVCTPAQHTSARTPFDRDRTLWSSWVLGEASNANDEPRGGEAETNGISVIAVKDGTLDLNLHRLYFAGDTGYRHVESLDPTAEEEAKQPACPAFKEIGEHLGPFDLALLPIGLCLPRNIMSSVHCAPEDAICVHRDIKAKKSVGMHYGTVRGALSGQYEDVRYPPRRFEQLCNEQGLRWGDELGLCKIGETVLVE